MKDNLRLPLPQRDSGSEEGGSSPASSPRPERGPLGGLLMGTHRALLASGSLLASVGLGRCLDFPPRVPPRTHPSSLGDRTPSEPEIPPPKAPLVSDPAVVDDLITFSTTSQQLPKVLLDVGLQPPGLKPMPLTPPPPNPRERSGLRTPQALHSPQIQRSPLQHGRASPGEWALSSQWSNGELSSEPLEHKSERRRRSSQGLHGSQLGQSSNTESFCIDNPVKLSGLTQRPFFFFFFKLLSLKH